jgi:replicative DNA helicase
LFKKKYGYRCGVLAGLLSLIPQQNDPMAEKNTWKPSNKPVLAGLEAGKIPPQALEIEEIVLGAIMLEKDAIISIMDILRAECFYKDEHQKIFRAAIDLSTKQQPIDILTITEELRKRDELESVGGPYYIAHLTSRVASAANIEYHARIISQKYIQRELIRVSSEILGKSYEESMDVDDLLDFAEDQMFKVAEGNIKKETQRINGLIKLAIDQIQEAGRREDSLSGVPSGYTRLDRITSGWQKSDLVIIAARPSMGKTAFILSMTRNMAVEHNRGIAIFSLEMSSLQLVNRLIVSETELPHDKIRNGKLENYEWEQLDYKIKNLVDAPIFIDDTPAISVFELRAKCRRLKSQHDIQLVIIDYLQLMSGPAETKGNREQEVSTISRSLKALAKELDIPVIALSQLNRSVEMRGGSKRPQLSDLRESGAIEQDADIVIFIHRPEKYGFLEDEEGNSLVGLAEIIIAKHRNGALDDVQLRFKQDFAKFVDLEDDIPMIADGPIKPAAMTIGSKMNEDPGFEKAGHFDLGVNRGFDEEPPF